jgi:hypothetical protein
MLELCGTIMIAGLARAGYFGCHRLAVQGLVQAISSPAMQTLPSLCCTSCHANKRSDSNHPTDYVNIAATESRKRAACFLHASQQPAKFYAYHEKMHGFRGFEAGCQRAEAFVHHKQSPAVQLPG